jgi:cytochrome c5
VATGQDALLKNSISGIRAMPPRGGNGALSDAQLRAALDYMLAAVK